MSSSYVRTQVKNFLDTNAPSETVIDLSGRYEDLEDMLAEGEIDSNSPWVGVQFIGSDEIPITIGSTNSGGKYRETGAVYIHVVDIAKLGVSDTILTRAETLRSLFRGRHIGDIIIDSVTPINFDAGAALRFEGGYMSGTFIIGYYRDLDF
jgi:hypothetical protein